MEDSIKRLRASRDRFLEAEQATWTRNGREWAMNTAEFPELERLADVDPSHLEADGDPSALMHELASAYFDDKEPHACQIEQMSGELFGEGYAPKQRQLAWFVKGAQEYWHEARLEL